MLTDSRGGTSSGMPGNSASRSSAETARTSSTTTGYANNTLHEKGPGPTSLGRPEPTSNQSVADLNISEFPAGRPAAACPHRSLNSKHQYHSISGQHQRKHFTAGAACADSGSAYSSPHSKPAPPISGSCRARSRCSSTSWNAPSGLNSSTARSDTHHRSQPGEEPVSYRTSTAMTSRNSCTTRSDQRSKRFPAKTQSTPQSPSSMVSAAR